MVEDTARFWDEKYRQEEPLGREPAALLSEYRHLLPQGGKALDAATGTGRNALYLASLGFQVTGIDISTVAVERLREEALRRGLAVQVVLANLESYQLPPAEYDLVVSFYYLDRGMPPRLKAALKPSGVLAFESFTVGQPSFGWGPTNLEFLLRPGELRGMFPSLEVLLYREGTFASQRGRKAIASLIARRPP